MSANLALNSDALCHGLLDDRESALHVLMYMAMRYLRHDRVKHLRGHLAMFDDYYVLADGSVSGSESKLTTITSNGPRVKFDITAITDLITALCTHFAALYRFRDQNPGMIDPPSDRDGKPATTDPLANPVSLEEATIEDFLAAFHQKYLRLITKPDWLYSLFRHHISRIPDRAAHETDWVDNTPVLREVPKNTNGKRGRANEQWDQKRGSKLIKSRDGSARAIDPLLELPPAGSLAAFIGTRLSLPRSGME